MTRWRTETIGDCTLILGDCREARATGVRSRWRPMTLHISYKGEPRGQGRPRATTRGGRAGMYEAPADRAYKAKVRACALNVTRYWPPYAVALTVTLEFRMPIRPSYPRKMREAMLAGDVPHMRVPDCDNMAKAVLDALNGVVWVDDAQIARLNLHKIYHAEPGVEIFVERYLRENG